jgi:dTMP kinase
MLKGGFIVLCDRYTYTAFARDTVRGCDPRWLRNLYGFARQPDITLYFRLPLEVSLGRILEGRPRLKYFEAGMDLGLTSDIQESFRIFQGRVMAEYERLSQEFGFVLFDATGGIHEQQAQVRAVIAERIELARYHRRGRQ